jgi:hypothetical protein
MSAWLHQITGRGDGGMDPPQRQTTDPSAPAPKRSRSSAPIKDVKEATSDSPEMPLREIPTWQCFHFSSCKSASARLVSYIICRIPVVGYLIMLVTSPVRYTRTRLTTFSSSPYISCSTRMIPVHIVSRVPTSKYAFMAIKVTIHQDR